MQSNPSTNESRIPLEDVGTAIRECRDLRPAHLYRIVVLDDQLNERHLDLTDPVPTARQILQAAAVRSVDDYSVYAILPLGEFEDLRLDETFDLRGRGAERFVVFETDRVFKFTIDGRQMEWGKPNISGKILKSLATVSADTHDVYLEVRGGQDRLIEIDGLIDLTVPGIERFITVTKPALTFEIIVNSRQHVVPTKQVTFEQVVQLAFPGQQQEPDAVFSMTYRHAVSKPHAGELGPGGTVEVKKGTVFNVTKTIKS